MHPYGQSRGRKPMRLHCGRSQTPRCPSHRVRRRVSRYSERHSRKSGRRYGEGSRTPRWSSHGRHRLATRHPRRGRGRRTHRRLDRGRGHPGHRRRRRSPSYSGGRSRTPGCPSHRSHRRSPRVCGESATRTDPTGNVTPATRRPAGLRVQNHTRAPVHAGCHPARSDPARRRWRRRRSEGRRRRRRPTATSAYSIVFVLARRPQSPHLRCEPSHPEARNRRKTGWHTRRIGAERKPTEHRGRGGGDDG